MKIFSKDKYIREKGMYDDRTFFQYGNWVDECDGKTVTNGYCGNYLISDRWCIDVPEDVNCKCAVKSTPARYKIIIECDGTTTTARMEINGKEVKTAQAKRNPADKFSWRVGAETAFGRLFCKKQGEKKERPFKAGDRVVRVVASYDNKETFGKHGKVIRGEVPGMANVAVEFDKKIEHGHVRRIICESPKVDAVPVRHGRWDENGRCTNCGGHAPFWAMATTYYKSPYCHECGAKMDGGAD